MTTDQLAEKAAREWLDSIGMSAHTELYRDKLASIISRTFAEQEATIAQLQERVRGLESGLSDTLLKLNKESEHTAELLKRPHMERGVATMTTQIPQVHDFRAGNCNPNLCCCAIRIEDWKAILCGQPRLSAAHPHPFRPMNCENDSGGWDCADCKHPDYFPCHGDSHVCP